MSISLASGLAFENVSFAYPARPDITVVNELNFRLNPGETVAVVGSSGSGKSTCAQLLLRFYDPASGSIRVNDGPTIDEINMESYRQQVAIVSQEPVLFATTIRENIQYGNDLATFEDIENAARQANAHDFIMALPKKYDTIVGHRGTQLSGGEKQRVCLARALVRQAPILLLDEVTSALDTQSEAIVQQALDQACRDNQRTTLMITHRLSTARNADRIIVMRKGAVIEQGKPQELLTKENGAYAGMVARQQKGLDDENLGGDGTEQPDTAIGTDAKPSQLKSKEATLEASKQGIIKDEDELEGKPLSTLASIWELSRTAWPWLLGGCLSSIVVSFRTVLWTYLLGKVMSGLAEQTDTLRLNNLLIVSFALLVLGFGTCLACWFSYFFFGRASALLTEQLRLRTFKTLLRQEVGWFDRKENNSGRLSKLLESDAVKIQTTIGTILVTVVEVISTLVSGIILSGILLDYKITLVYIGLIIILTAVCWLYTALSKYITKKQRSVLEDLNMMAIESTQNIRTVFELNRQKSFTERFSKLADESVKIPLRYMHVVGLLCGIEMSRMFFLVPAILVLMVHIGSEKEMSMEQLFLVVSFGSFVNQTYTMMYAALPKLGSSLAAAQYFTLLFQRKSRITLEDTEQYEPLPQLDQIEFDHVKFSYPTRSAISALNDLNLTLKVGQSIALVGSTGCGKSTILALIERFYDATDGEVRVNSNNIRQVNLQHHRSCIAYVGQEPVLFNMSIRDNITYGSDKNSFTMNDIIAAATKANIHAFIQTLPEGYDTSIGQFGARISGGERQRIAIARAFARKPQLLLLDEPTSALDVENEQLVQDALQHTDDNVTSITVAHRLSTIRHVDKIYVMQRGRIVESGKHEELVNRPNGIYAQLYSHSIRSTTA